MPIGYKVVRPTNENDVYRSACYKLSSVKYKVGQTTIPEPDCGPLGVFHSIERAKKFIDICCLINQPHRIFEVEYQESEYNYFWHKAEQMHDYGVTETIFADSVTLICPVDPDAGDLAQLIAEVDNV